MRIRQSSSRKEHLVQGYLRSNLNGRLRDGRWVGRALMAGSVTLGLALLAWAGVYTRAWRPVLPRLRGRSAVAGARGNGLSTLRLDLDLEAYQALAMQRQRALQTGILYPADAPWIPAWVQFEGRTVPVRVRLAGSEPDGIPSVDHWAPRKWSLEVEAEGRATLRDARAFSLLSPATRGYLNGWLYAEAVRRAGLPAPGYDADTLRPYVNLSLNGERWGVYALEAGSPAAPSDLDAERLGRSLAHADLWGARLPQRLAPAAPGAEHRPRHLAALDTPVAGPPLAGLPAGGDPAVAEAYAREAATISQPEYLRVLRRIYGRAFRRYHDALAPEFFSAYLRAPWDALAARQRTLSAALQSGEPTPGAPAASGAVPGASPPLPDVDLPPAPSMEGALARHPFLRAADRPGFLRVTPGTWHVQGDLVLPAGVGLWASEAFTLTFARDAALVVRGPLALEGPEGEGMRLLPEGDHWGGIYVLGTDQGTGSTLRNVEVRGARGIRRGAWKTEGGITFWNAPVRLDRCRVLDTYAPAAVHIVGGSFEWVHSEFGVAYGDLLRAEDAQGRIERCAFHDALGSAIRLTGSEVDVQGVSLLRVREAALLAGAGSAVRAQGLRATDVGLAVAAVDGAAVQVHDARLGQAQIAGFAAYGGGAAGAPATVEASAVVFEDSSPPALVQAGNRVTVDGLPALARDLETVDVDRSPETSPPLRPLHVRFGPSIWLIGYQLTTPELALGETVEVILYWRTFAPLDRQYTIFLHVRDASGEWVTGWDMMPRYNTYPTTDWPVARLIDDVHIVPLSPEVRPGEYTLALGLYYWGTGERLPAYTRQGDPIPEGAVVLEEKVTVK